MPRSCAHPHPRCRVRKSCFTFGLLTNNLTYGKCGATIKPQRGVIDNRGVTMKRFSLLFVPVVLAATVLASPAVAGQPDLDRARAQLMRLQIRLQYEAETTQQVKDAYKSAGAAYSEMYMRRAEVLTLLYQTQEYADLRLALYHTQRKLAGVHEEIPVRIQHIMDSATDVLAVRVQITRLEAATLEASPDFVVARDYANAMNAAYRQTLRDSLADVRTHPEFMALVDQVASMQSSLTGMRRSMRNRP